MSELPSELPNEAPAKREPYSAPKLTELGSVQLLTLAGTQGVAETMAQMARMV